jgi:hypothetical protein
MKKSLPVVLALALFSFSACDEDGTTPVDTSAEYLGKLEVKVFDNSINVVSNTPVYLYRNLDDLIQQLLFRGRLHSRFRHC